MKTKSASALFAAAAIVGVLWASLWLASASAQTNSPDPSLNLIQKEIASFDSPGGYYATTYRASETRYWVNLPGWMRADAASHRVQRVLDIGCGYGTLLAFAAELHHAEPYCMDVIHYMPEFGKSRGFHFLQGNIQLDPIPDPGIYDVIIMTEVLEHFNFDPLPTMKRIHDALAPDGIFYLSTPDARDWGRQTKYYSHLKDLPPASREAKFIDDHIWIYDKSEIMSLVAKAGFRMEHFAWSPGVGR